MNVKNNEINSRNYLIIFKSSKISQWELINNVTSYNFRCFSILFLLLRYTNYYYHKLHYFNIENTLAEMCFEGFLRFLRFASQRGTSDSVTYSSILSNPTDAQNVSCLGLCDWDICPKSWVLSTLSCYYLYK